MAKSDATQETQAQDRSPRDSESREATQRVTQWAPPAKLPMPKDRPGYVHRWVRTSMVGQADPQNVSMRMREGWEPCRAEDYPEMADLVDKSTDWGKKGGIEVGGLLLCKCAKELMDQRKEYYERMAAGQMEAVDNALMRESDPRMPIHQPQRKTKVEFGRDRED